jgi:VanZ family protein
MPERRVRTTNPPRPLWFGAFCLYALLLACTTHWPLPVLVDAPTHSDKLIHFGAFLIWTTLLALSGLVPRSRHALTIILTISLCYAILDELTQGIPGINRHVSAGDLVANALGVIAGVLIRIPLTRRYP